MVLKPKIRAEKAVDEGIKEAEQEEEPEEEAEERMIFPLKVDVDRVICENNILLKQLLEEVRKV